MYTALFVVLSKGYGRGTSPQHRTAAPLGMPMRQPCRSGPHPRLQARHNGIPTSSHVSTHEHHMCMRRLCCNRKMHVFAQPDTWLAATALSVCNCCPPAVPYGTPTYAPLLHPTTPIQLHPYKPARRTLRCRSLSA